MKRDLPPGRSSRESASRLSRRVDAATRSRAERARRRLAAPPPRRNVAGLDLGPRRPPISVSGQASRFAGTSPAGRAARADARWGGYRGSAASVDRFPRRAWLVGALLFLALAATGVFLNARMAETPMWAVQRVEVRGNRIVSSDQIEALCEVQVGTPWWSALLSLGKTHWDDLPRVESARLRLSGWGGLGIEIVEREPVLRWMSQPARGIAEDGTLLEFAPYFDARDLPCVSGAVAADSVARATLAETRWHATLMNLRRDSPALWRSISQVEIESDRRIRVFFRNAERVILWDPYINEHLWKQIPGILEDLATRGVAGDAVLDLRFRDRVVVRIPEALWYETWEGVPDGASGTETAVEGARA